MSATLKAPLAIVLGMMVLAFSDNFIFAVAERMGVWQYHALRSAMILPVMVAVTILIGQGRSLWPVRPGMVLMRSCFAITALFIYFAAIPAISVSMAAAGMFTSPIWVVLISLVVFRERIGPRRIAGLMLGFAGVCLVLGVGTEPMRAIAAAPMLAGVLYALNVIWTRRYCHQESAAALAFWNMAVFLVSGLAGMAAAPWLAGSIGHIEGTGFAVMAAQPLDAEGALIVLGMGVAGAIGMVCLARGYREAPSTYAALFDYSFLFWVPLFSWLLWGDLVSTRVAGGMALIVVAGCLATLGAGQTGPATDSPERSG